MKLGKILAWMRVALLALAAFQVAVPAQVFAGVVPPPISATAIKNNGGQLYRDNRDGLYPLGCRSGINIELSTSDYAQSMVYIIRNGSTPLKNLHLIAGNGMYDKTTGLWSTTGVSRLHLRASIEYPRTSVLFKFVGQPGTTGTNNYDVYADPGAWVDMVITSDVVIPANTTIAVKVLAETVDSSNAQLTSGRLPVGQVIPNLSGWTFGANASATDPTQALNVSAGAQGSASKIFTWTFIGGEPATSASRGAIAWAAFGDSITQYWGDHYSQTSDSDGNQGWQARYCGANHLGMVNFGAASTKSSQWTLMASGNNGNLAPLLRKIAFTHATVAYSVNDVTASTAGATIYANDIAIVDWLWGDFRIKSNLTTGTPTVTTTDFYATVTGQVVNSGNDSRMQAYNTLVRAGNPSRSAYLGPYFDIETIWAGRDNSNVVQPGRWKASAYDWTGATSLTCTGALSAAVSCTLSSAFTGTTGSYAIKFSDGTIRDGNLTNGNTSMTWSGTVTATSAVNVIRDKVNTRDGVHPEAPLMSTINTDLGSPSNYFH